MASADATVVSTAASTASPASTSFVLPTVLPAPSPSGWNGGAIEWDMYGQIHFAHTAPQSWRPFSAFRWQRSLVDDVLAEQPTHTRYSGSLKWQTRRPDGDLNSHEQAIMQLRARGLTYEPAATGLTDGADGTWRPLEEGHVQVLEVATLQAFVKRASAASSTDTHTTADSTSATPTAQVSAATDSITDTPTTAAVTTATTTAATTLSTAASQPSWMSIAHVLGLPSTLLGLVALSAEQELVGFVQLRCIYRVAADSWQGPGDNEPRLPYPTADGATDERPHDTRISFLPLSALRDSVLPAMSTIDAEQGGLAHDYLAAVVDLIARLKASEGFAALSVATTDPELTLTIECELYKILHAIPVPSKTGPVPFFVQYFDDEGLWCDSPSRPQSAMYGAYPSKAPPATSVTLSPPAVAS